MLAKIKKDFRKHWLWWICFIGYIALGIPLCVFIKLEQGVTAPWESYAYVIKPLTGALFAWVLAWITFSMLKKYRVRLLKDSKSKEAK